MHHGGAPHSQAEGLRVEPMDPAILRAEPNLALPNLSHTAGKDLGSRRWPFLYAIVVGGLRDVLATVARYDKSARHTNHNFELCFCA